VGGAIYISCGYLDICYDMHEIRYCSSSESCQQVMSNPGKKYWKVVKWILRYLKGSSDITLCYDGTDIHLHGYVDFDFAGDVDSQRSTTGYVFTLGSGAVSWVSRLQKIVALSTTEVEYVAATEVCKELIWLNDFMKDLSKEQVTPLLHNDIQSAINLANNSVYHDRTRTLMCGTTSSAFF